MPGDVCIIAPSSIRYVPYLRHYEEVLVEAGISRDLLLWDRFGTGESPPNARAYQRPGTARGLALLPAYAGFRRFLLRHLKARPYRAYIVLATQVAVLLYDFLRTKPFLLDIRDYSHEGMWPYRALAFDLARRARMVAISSRGFLTWLPEGIDYVVSHNVAGRGLRREAAPFDRGRRVLSYIGAVSYFSANARFLEGVGRQQDWEVRYIGRGVCERELESLCRVRGITNVSFHGAFHPEEKGTLYDEANFVLGIYDDESPVGRTLTPNRLYEACVHRRPLVVNRGTHLADLVTNEGLGVAIDLGEPDSWARALAPYYETRFYEGYVERCGAFLERVEEDIASFGRRVREGLATAGVHGTTRQRLRMAPGERA